jgi:hypothetical protein
VILLSALLFLAVCYLIVSFYQSPSRKKFTLWLTQEGFYKFIEGKSLALPDGESLTLHKEQIESLTIEPGGDGAESEAAEVSFVVRTDRMRYGVQGVMSLHSMDGTSYPIVNLGRGWNVSKR